MPNRQTKVEATAESGVIRLTVPTQPPSSPPTATQTEVTPGTSVHEVLVTDAPMPPSGAPDDTGPERRRQQTPVQVQVQQPNAGGLTGWPAIVANMSAVGVLMMFLFWVYRDSQSNQREAFRQIQDDRRQDRSDVQSQTAAMVAAIGQLTSSIGATNASNQAIASEFRAARNEDRRDRQEMLMLLRAMAKEKQRPDEPEPDMSRAPMPRAKAVVGGSS